jgi:hypothetical protein
MVRRLATSATAGAQARQNKKRTTDNERRMSALIKCFAITILAALQISCTNSNTVRTCLSESERYCCEPTISNTVEYTMRDTKGCSAFWQNFDASLPNFCNGFMSESLRITGSNKLQLASSAECTCGKLNDLPVLEWYFDCTNPKCTTRKPETYASSEGFCMLFDDVVDIGTKALSTIFIVLVVIVVIVIATVALIVYFCCCRRRTQVVFVQPQVGVVRKI